MKVLGRTLIIYLYIPMIQLSEEGGNGGDTDSDPNESESFAFRKHQFPGPVTDGLVLLRFHLTVMSPVDQQGSEESFPNLLPPPTEN